MAQWPLGDVKWKSEISIGGLIHSCNILGLEDVFGILDAIFATLRGTDGRGTGDVDAVMFDHHSIWEERRLDPFFHDNAQRSRFGCRESVVA